MSKCQEFGISVLMGGAKMGPYLARPVRSGSGRGFIGFGASWVFR